MYPDHGFTLVECDKLKPPGDVLTTLAEYDSLEDITMPPSTNLTDYVIYDSVGRGYSRDDL